MPAVVSFFRRDVGAFIPAPKISLSMRILREGEVTSGQKLVRLYRGFDGLGKLDLVFWAPPGDGEFSFPQWVDLATFQAQGEWLAIGSDDALPRKVRADWLRFDASGTYAFNITTGDGGGGSPATVDALARVDGARADRQIVVIERPSTGLWRVAGYGPTPDGSGAIELKVTDGQCYALGLDDWGVVFTADLDVLPGQTIRPTVYNGWLYRITEAGRLPSVEPEWWAGAGEGDTRPLGTARAVAVRYYQPIGHGPIPVEIL